MRLLRGSDGEQVRRRLARFVRTRYRESYNAEVSDFLPELIGVMDSRGRLVGCGGIQMGVDPHPFFLERYLDASVEAHLHDRGMNVSRNQIAEVGNLAVQLSGSGLYVMGALAAFLEGREIELAVFSATSQLRHIFRKLDAGLVELGPASAERVGASADRWGTYYEQDPRVSVVSVPRVRAHIEATLPDLLNFNSCAYLEGSASSHRWAA